MKIHPLLMLLVVIGPSVASAEGLLGGLKEGAAKAATAVGNVTEGAVDVAGKAATTVTDSVAASRQGLQDEATPEETRHKLDLMAETTLERLLKEQPGSRALLDRSAGYAVFDKREASFYVVAGYGRGVAVDPRTGARTYMK
ncbi:MAG: hypothetical protein MUC77_20170, partial [Chromatiaceae bacterium]|nr:hypothetical protein [Chromatiaceae bacterium]